MQDPAPTSVTRVLLHDPAAVQEPAPMLESELAQASLPMHEPAPMVPDAAPQAPIKQDPAPIVSFLGVFPGRNNRWIETLNMKQCQAVKSEVSSYDWYIHHSYVFFCSSKFINYKTAFNVSPTLLASASSFAWMFAGSGTARAPWARKKTAILVKFMVSDDIVVWCCCYHYLFQKENEKEGMRLLIEFFLVSSAQDK